jgi:RHS repeat-associated protein
VLDADQATQNSYDYQAFGSVYGTPTENLSQPFRFTSREWDGECNLYYYRARMYSAGAGGFLARDPVGQPGGATAYVYALGDPALFVDPLGLKEAHCGPGCCKGQPDHRGAVNTLIQGLLGDIVKKSTGPHGRTSGWWNSVWSLSGGLTETPIEQDIYNQVLHLPREQWPGVSENAPCMKLCGACIGTDKIGHMFQQGGILDVIKDMKGAVYADAFSRWTEGLFDPKGADPKIKEWLQKGTLYVPGAGLDVNVKDMEKMWGGRTILYVYPLEASWADHRANIKGALMWDWLKHNWTPQGVGGFNICNWVNKNLQDFE